MANVELFSKLDPTKYKMDDPKKWLKWAPGTDRNIDPVFAGRLAAFARDWGKGNLLENNSGYRDLKKQEKIFFERGGLFDKNKGYFWPNSIPSYKQTVAKPGSSYHNYRLAIDTTSPWAKAIEKDARTSDQIVLAKYGLLKPMTSGNRTKVFEDWHIQPIETWNLTLFQRQELAPQEGLPTTLVTPGFDGSSVLILKIALNKRGYKLILSTKYDTIAQGAVKDFQRTRGLVIDGVVGPRTWTELLHG